MQYRKATDSIWITIPTLFTANSYQLNGLEASNRYYVRVRSLCNDTNMGYWCNPVYFTTLCLPANLPFFENFNDLIEFPPSNCWNINHGLLPVDGTSALLETHHLDSVYYKWQLQPFVDDQRNLGALLNICHTVNEWLITPSINLGYAGDAVLEFDVALAAYFIGGLPEYGADDRFIVLVSSDESWSENNAVAIWDNVASSKVFNNISSISEHVRIPLSNFNGIVRIAFYGESTEYNADNNLHIDNISITGSSCPPIRNLQTNVTNINVEVKWEKGNEIQSKWEVSCNQQGNATNISRIVNDTICFFQGLTQGSTYVISVRAICAEGDTSGYVTHSFRTINCEQIENITIDFIPNTDSILVYWDINSCHESWQVCVVQAGGSIENGIIENVSTLQGIKIKLNNLYNSYDVYVRGYCGNNVYSPWKSSRILNIENPQTFPVKINLTPNPAHISTTLSIEGIRGEVQLTLMTMEGKILRNEKINCQHTVSKNIALQGLPNGTYLLQIIHNGWRRVEKLIIQ